MSGPKIVLARKSGSAALKKRIDGLTKLAAYVGIPSSTSEDRSRQLLAMAGKAKGARRKKLEKAAKDDVTNAEMLYIFSKGSPARKQPARPVLEPAVAADGNRQAIAHEIAASAKASIAGEQNEARRGMQRAAMAGQNAARRWFTDPRNHWAPNTPSTIARKGSDRPGIDTGAMRNAIVGIVSED
jgi:hypothetical protein